MDLQELAQKSRQCEGCSRLGVYCQGYNTVPKQDVSADEVCVTSYTMIETLAVQLSEMFMLFSPVFSLVSKRSPLHFEFNGGVASEPV